MFSYFSALFLLFVIIVSVTFVYEWKGATGNTNSYVSIVTQEVSTVDQKTTDKVVDAASPITLPEKLVLYFDEHAPLVVLVWMIFVLGHFIKLLSGLNYIHQIRHRGIYAVPDIWKKRLAELKHQLGILQQVVLLQSGIIKVPVVIGLTKPLILVPLSLLTNLPASYIESILLHELAHIRRKDFGVNLVQSLMEMIFFFNPALLWISARMREEREACCDDIVLAHGGDKKSYLEALVYFQEQSIADASYAMALKGNRNYLLTRVKRMLTQENKKLTVMEKNILAFGLVGLSALAFIPQNEKDTLAPLQKLSAIEAPLTTAVIKETPQTAQLKALQLIDQLPAKQAVKAKEPVSPVPVIKDTIPQKQKTETQSSSTSTTIDDDGTKTSEIITTENDGKTYHIKKVNGEITLFKVDGKTIAPEDMGAYKQLLEDVERREKEADKKRVVADEKRKIADQKRREMDQQRIALDKQRRKIEQQRMEIDEQRNAMREQRVRADEKRREVTEQRQMTEEKRREVREHRKEADAKRKESQRSNSEVDAIIQELVSQKIIKAGEPLSFTLTQNELTVNGNKQDAAVQQKLKEKYGLGNGDSLQYQTDGKGSTSTTVVRN